MEKIQPKQDFDLKINIYNIDVTQCMYINVKCLYLLIKFILFSLFLACLYF